MFVIIFFVYCVGMSQLCAHNFMNNRHLCESGMIGTSVNQE